MRICKWDVNGRARSGTESLRNPSQFSVRFQYDLYGGKRMRTLRITLIATAIATVVSFWAWTHGLMQRLWPEHPQLAGFFLCLLVCVAVQLFWPKHRLDGDRTTR